MKKPTLKTFAALAAAALLLIGAGTARAQFTMPVGFQGDLVSPRDLPNCYIALQSDLGITTVSGKVSVWTNQANGIDGSAAQTVAGSRPVYTSSGGLNNRPFLTFNASAFLDWTTSQSNGVAHTIVAVAKLAAEPHTGFTILEWYSSSAARYAEMIVDFSGYQYDSYVADYVSGATNMSGSNTSWGTTNGHVLLFTYDGTGTGTAAHYTDNLDGTAGSVVSSGAYGNSDLASKIGSRTSGSFALNGDIYAIYMYTQKLPVYQQKKLARLLKRVNGTL